MANYKKQVIEKLNELAEYDNLEYGPVNDNIEQSEMITFEGCQALEVHSLEEAEKQYRVMFDEFVEEWGEQDTLEWAYVVENDYDNEDVKSYNLIVRRFFKEEA